MIRNRFAAALCAATFALLAVSPSPAHAHAGLTGSNPADGATLDALPQTVSLTFSEDVGTPAFVALTDVTGSNAVTGDPAVDGNTITQTVDVAAGPGQYTLAYRVVSADGHPITGELDFTVATPTVAPTPTPTAPATPVPSDATAEHDAGSHDHSDDSDGFFTEHGVHLALGAGLVLIAVGLLVIVRRRRD